MGAVYVVDAVRTAIGRLGGSLAPVRTDDLAAVPLRALLDRSADLDPGAVDEVILGCANQAGEDCRNVARMASLLAGLPPEVPGLTVNRLCGSGLSAVVAAARALAVGDAEVILAGGVEHMTRAPYVLSKASKAFGRDSQLYDTSLGWRFVNPRLERLYGIDSMGQTAENLAREHDISREDQDAFALASQRKAVAARESGRLAREIVAVEVPRRKAEPLVFDRDEFPRPDSSAEALAKLRPVFVPEPNPGKPGTVTAGNASGLNDGAAALLLASEEGLRRHGLVPRARLLASAVVGVEPRIMGIGPVPASRRALERAGLDLDAMDVIEINEAFAAQVLACTRSLELADDDPRINPSGGAIALGHPLGMSGARLLTTALLQLEEADGRHALCTLCVGVGQGVAAVLERVS
ncbi:MAG: 3-oxoadipyl-CoA thiolase [Acidobacteriota bacterium]|nr:3-oxoadipyl-CoA thiolase [Acidobacteriota bacterium]